MGCSSNICSHACKLIFHCAGEQYRIGEIPLQLRERKQSEVGWAVGFFLWPGWATNTHRARQKTVLDPY